MLIIQSENLFRRVLKLTTPLDLLDISDCFLERTYCLLGNVVTLDGAGVSVGVGDKNLASFHLGMVDVIFFPTFV